MTVQSRIVDPGDRVVPGQEGRDLFRVFDMPRHAQRQGFDPLQQIEGVGRAHHRAEIAQAFRPRPSDEARRTIFFREDDTVISGIGFGHGRELFRFREPVEPTRIDQDTAHRRAVPADPFRRGMHDQVRAEIERLAQIGRVEGRVDHQRQTVTMRDVGDLFDIQDFQIRIAQDFRENQPRFRADGGLEFLRLAGIDQRRRDAETRQGMQEHIDGPAIQRLGRHDMAALPHQG